MNKPISPPSKKSIRIIVQLNDRWRVVESPPQWPPQWILQRRQRGCGPKGTGWEGKAYCTSRAALFRNIREHCGEVHPCAASAILGLPERLPGRLRRQP